jgi:FkbM family methyltransferase
MNPLRRFRSVLRGALRRRPAGKRLDLAAPWNIVHHAKAAPEDIFYSFRLLLGRSPTREEWPGHSSRAGRDLDGVVGSFVTSLEFSRRADALSGHLMNDHIVLKRLKGFSIYVQKDDAAVGHLVVRDAYESGVTAIFRERLRRGMHVLDVGANVGYFTMLSASLVGPSGSVTAIEPNPDCVKLLEASRRDNAFDNVTIIQVAAGREAGLLVLNPSYSNAMTSRLPDDVSALVNAMTVPSFRLDDLIPSDKSIDFLKIDVEGAEFNALLGASELIARCHPTIVSEFNPLMMPGISGVDGRGYLRFLLGFGYKISVIELDGRLRGCGGDPEAVMDAFALSGVDHIDLILD